MPAYFSIDFECTKSNRAVSDLYNAFIKAGAKFKCGHEEKFNKETFESIVNWNQQQLNKNYPLNMCEDTDENYRQMEFEFADFDEVRAFMINYEPEAPWFYVHFIVPEYDLVDSIFENGEMVEQEHRYYDKMNQLRDFAEQVWSSVENVRRIQTSWECTYAEDIIPDEEEHIPNTTPFSIIPTDLFNENWKGYFDEMKPIDRNGIVLVRDENWDWVWKV